MGGGLRAAAAAFPRAPPVPFQLWRRGAAAGNAPRLGSADIQGFAVGAGGWAFVEQEPGGLAGCLDPCPACFGPAFPPFAPPLQDLLQLLLLPDAAAAALGGAAAAAGLGPGLPTLNHLALVYPPRSVIPPTSPLPDALSTMTQVLQGGGGRGGGFVPLGVAASERTQACTAGESEWEQVRWEGSRPGRLCDSLPAQTQVAACLAALTLLPRPLPSCHPVPRPQLTALKLKRYPVTGVPTFLGALTQLHYLLWDPALPADTPCERGARDPAGRGAGRQRGWGSSRSREACCSPRSAPRAALGTRSRPSLSLSPVRTLAPGVTLKPPHVLPPLGADPAARPGRPAKPKACTPHPSPAPACLFPTCADAMPPGLGALARLECLWVVVQWPLELPASLAGSLQVGLLGANEKVPARALRGGFCTPARTLCRPPWDAARAGTGAAPLTSHPAQQPPGWRVGLGNSKQRRSAGHTQKTPAFSSFDFPSRKETAEPPPPPTHTGAACHGKRVPRRRGGAAALRLARALQPPGLAAPAGEEGWQAGSCAAPCPRPLMRGLPPSPPAVPLLPPAWCRPMFMPQRCGWHLAGGSTVWLCSENASPTPLPICLRRALAWRSCRQR